MQIQLESLNVHSPVHRCFLKKISYGETSNITSANTRWRRVINKQLTEGPASVDSIKKNFNFSGALHPLRFLSMFTITGSVDSGGTARAGLGLLGSSSNSPSLPAWCDVTTRLGSLRGQWTGFKPFRVLCFFDLKEPPTWNLEESGA